MIETGTRLNATAAIKAARELAAGFSERAGYYDRTAEFPFENFERLHKTGLMNLTVPEEFGGSGLGIEAAARVTSTIAEGEPSTALVLAMHYIYHGFPAVTGTWNPKAREVMGRESVARVAPINVIRVEPELGTPSRGGLPLTTATPSGGGWRLSGHKLYATGSPLLAYFICWARTAGDVPQVGWFAVPRDTPGLSIVETWDHMGMRATGSHDLYLEDAEIPYEYALDIRPPEKWSFLDPANAAWNSVVLAALYHGIARAATNWLKQYLHERVPSNLGASLATLPRFQSSVGEMEALLWENERLIYGVAAEIDRDGYDSPGARQTSLVKMAATNNAVRVVDIGLSLIGNPALARANPIERHHRDVLCSRIHVPQDDMVLLLSGKAALGIQP